MKVLQTFALPLGYGTIIRNGAVDGARTRDLHLGKVALYQLSYYRKTGLLYHLRRAKASTFWKLVRAKRLELIRP